MTTTTMMSICELITVVHQWYLAHGITWAQLKAHHLHHIPFD
jgi:hypothetical protein